MSEKAEKTSAGDRVAKVDRVDRVEEEEVRISPRTGKPIQKKYAPKKKRRAMPQMAHGKNSPVIGTNGLNLNEGDNAKYMAINMALFNMPLVDLEDADAVQKRLNEFFALYLQADTKPTVAGMAMALGMNRATLVAIARDYATSGQGYKSALPRPVTNCIKKAYTSMEVLWENYMNNGKINPVTGIFLGKNNYQYRDQTEHIVTPSLGDDNISAADIKKRYIEEDTNTDAEITNDNSL